ncbi:hypothetical protein WG66_014174 [Moniliophthora roreri]|nr:hypothetical protein WG66_014174 [Moniliophthora roreri]
MSLSTFFLQLTAVSGDESAQKFDLDTTMGAAFVGMSIAAILYGISIIQTYQYFSNPGHNDRWHIKSLWLSILVNALAAAGDVYIAATLCWLLHSSRTGFRRSDTIIKKLILFTVNTGALTSLCAVASLISITAAPNTFIYITFFFCIGRLYANSLLATLNARGTIRESADEAEYNTTHGIGGFGFKGAAGSGSFASRGTERPSNGISIQINRTQEFKRDASPIRGEKSSGRRRREGSIIGDEMDMDMEMEMEMNPVHGSDHSDSGGTITIRKLSFDIV